MKNKRIQIWNSELAYRIENQLEKPEQAIFRKILSQNELDERQLRNLLSRWRRRGQGKSFSEFLVDSGLLSVEWRKIDNLDSLACDSENEELWVLLSPEARFDPPRTRSVRILFSRLASMILSKVIPEPINTEEVEPTASTHCLLRAEKEETCSRTIFSNTYTLGEPDSDEGAKSTSPAPFEGTADEFDPYATVCS